MAVGMLPLAMALFALGAGSLADGCGRKPAIGISSGFLLAGNVVWAFCNGFWTLLLARVLLGAGIGIGLAVITTYVSEVAPSSTRGFFSVEMSRWTSAAAFITFHSSKLYERSSFLLMFWKYKEISHDP